MDREAFIVVQRIDNFNNELVTRTSLNGRTWKLICSNY